MPDLNIKGNTLDNFGKHLPTPVIEFVGIYNDRLEVQVSLFFDFTDLEKDTDTFLEYFTDPTQAPLYVTVAYVIGDTYAQAVIDKTQPDIFKELYVQPPSTSGCNSGAQFKLKHGNKGCAKYSNYNTISFEVDPTSTWVTSDQNFYTDDDKKLVQYSTTLTLNFDVSDKTFDINTLDDNIFITPTTGPDDSLADEFGGAITVFAFSSWYDLASPEFSGWNPATSQQPFPVKEIEIDDGYRKLPTFYMDLMPPLARQQVSDISYQQVFKNGNAYTDPEVLFADAAGIVYNHTPILSINGKYYKQDGYTLEQIVEDFSSLISASAILDEPTTQLESILNDLASTLEIYGESSELLIRLNLIRIAFPEKSTATEVGRFYELIKTRFFNAEQGVTSGTQVFEQLVHTSKVRDLRSILLGTYTPTDQVQVPVIYGANRGFNEGLVTSLKIWEYGADEESDAAVFLRNGFFFFDMEAALQNYSSLGRVFSLSGLEAKFGTDLIPATFKVKEARVKKWNFTQNIKIGGTKYDVGHLDNFLVANPGTTELDETNLNWVSTITSEVDYAIDSRGLNLSHKHTPQTSKIKVATTKDSTLSDFRTATDITLTTGAPTMNPQTGIEVRGGDTTTYPSYLFLRGVDALADTQLDNSYGLMTFQFQDVEQSFESVGGPGGNKDMDTVYSFEIDVEDTGKAVIQALTESFTRLFEDELQPYYDLASENCSYNNVDGKFNSFFTKGVLNYYSNVDKDRTPWVLAAAQLVTFRDMTTNAYGGDIEEMTAAARAIVGKINPVNGNLEDLTVFYNNYKEFADLYLEGGDIYNIVEAMEDVTTYQFGQKNVSHGDNTVVQYFPLGAPVPITTDALTAGCEISSCPSGQELRLPTEAGCFCAVVVPWTTTTFRHSLDWNDAQYTTMYGYSAAAESETLTEFVARMKRLFKDMLRGCGTCGVWADVNPGTRAGGWLEPDQIYAAVADSWLAMPWKDYYDNVNSKLIRSIEREEYKDAMILWCRWAWENCQYATHGRGDSNGLPTGVSWQHYIMDANLWGYGLLFGRVNYSDSLDP